jgi:SAM-dependent methyltransferase
MKNKQRRATYQPNSLPEEFIVPLLNFWIQKILDEYGEAKNAGSRVLDIGCGGQPFRQKLESLGYYYVSLDLQQNSEYSVDYIGKIDENLPKSLLQENSFNLLFCTEVMEHVADWNVAFSNFSQLLAEEGLLLITCPHFYFLHEQPNDFWRPTPYALKYYGERYNLEILYQVNVGDAWDILGTLLATCSSRPATNKLSDRIVSNLIFKGHRWLLRNLQNRNLQSSVIVNSPFYLSNLIIYKK